MAWSLAAVLLGPFVGSLIGLLTLRLPARRPVVWSRSACDGCGRTLTPADLVPIAGWLALRGRCRSCGSAIPRRYLWLEIACAGVALWAAAAGAGPQAFLGAVLGWQLILLASLDFEHFWLPLRLTLLLIATGLLEGIAQGQDVFAARALGAGIGFFGLWLVAFAYRRLRKREGLGGGDPWMMAGAGAWTGWLALPTVLLVAALAGLAYALWRTPQGAKVDGVQAVPFGVFIAIGTWVAWLYGPLGRGGL